MHYIWPKLICILIGLFITINFLIKKKVIEITITQRKMVCHRCKFSFVCFQIVSNSQEVPIMILKERVQSDYAGMRNNIKMFCETKLSNDDPLKKLNTWSKR